MPPGFPTRHHIERCVKKAADSSSWSRLRSKRLRVGAGDVDASWRGSFPENINVSILFGTAIVSRRARRLAPRVNPPNRHGVAHVPSPDVRYGHPALRSLHAGCAPPSWLRLPPSPAPGARAIPCLPERDDTVRRRQRAIHAPGAGVAGQRSQDGEAQAASSERRAWMPAVNVRRRGVGGPKPGWANRRNPCAEQDCERPVHFSLADIRPLALARPAWLA
jgi:hypothetical protein